MKDSSSTPKRPRAHISPRTAPGAPPGTLVSDVDAPPPRVTLTAYGPDECIERAIDEPSSIRNFLGQLPVTWVNVDGLGDASVIDAIGDLFDIHPLAREDTLSIVQRPKLEEYKSNLYVVVRMLALGGEFETEQVSIIVGPNYVITFQERAGDCFDAIRQRINADRGRIRTSGADYLAYALIDAIVDSYFPILEKLSERLYTVEDEILGDPRADLIADVYQTKRELLALRRSIWPLRDVLNSLVRDPTPFVSEETRVYLRDCYDHTVRIMDFVETYRELCSSLGDFYLSAAGQRMNEIMKVLTIMATIFIPLTFIAGIYGMNFDPESSPFNLPELTWYWGYPFALSLMGAVAIGMLLFFRRRGWL